MATGSLQMAELAAKYPQAKSFVIVGMDRYQVALFQVQFSLAGVL